MADQKEVLERISLVYSLLVTGKKTRDVVRFVTKKYNVCEKTAYIYAQRAFDLRSEDCKEYRENAIQDQLAILRNLYEKNYKIQDFKECRAILGQIATLLGLNEASKSEVKIIAEQPLFEGG